MTRYAWMIRTEERTSNETSGDVYFALHGLGAAAQEIRLPPRDYASQTVDSGTIETLGELGELQTGLLRTEDSDANSWLVDWVKVVNLTDGRQWTAQGGSCRPDGTWPLLRFARTCDALEVHKTEVRAPDEEDRNDSAKETGKRPMSPTALVRTYEIFGQHKGRVVPLAQILKIHAGTKQLVPGAQILITDQDSQGFGLGGEPGMWEDLYPGVSPAVYGLEPDMAVMASDGSRGWVMDAHYLAMIFGADWRRVVYGK